MLIGEVISQIRGVHKQIHSDTKLTNRLVFSMLNSGLDYFLGIEDSKFTVMSSNNIFKPLNFVELIDVDSVEACGITSECTLKRSKDKLPNMRSIRGMAVIKRVTSLDGSQDLVETTQRSYNKKSNLATFKYDKNLYFWYLDGYIYIPNVDWDGVSVLAYFTDTIEIDEMNLCNGESICESILDQEFPAPTHLLELIIDKASSKLASVYSRIPEDNNINKNTNVL